MDNNSSKQDSKPAERVDPEHVHHHPRDCKWTIEDLLTLPKKELLRAYLVLFQTLPDFNKIGGVHYQIIKQRFQRVAKEIEKRMSH